MPGGNVSRADGKGATMSRVAIYLNFMGTTEEAFGFAHAELPILAGHVLMGSDMVESMGHQLTVG